ncbi:MAG TPA: DUF2277 domain-containing protein [Acidimicrobiia bacterium]|nr:DUF2277 domain-containing protein [Acidimicrobiia bacterium]
MCRSIVRLREGAEVSPPEDIEAAARQFVRKVSGFSKPARHNQEVFDQAVAEIAASVERLMSGLQVRGA